jgi:hypothetical protein
MSQYNDSTGKARLTQKRARELTGGLGYPSKMPGTSYGISALNCQIGAKLAEISGSVCHGCYALKANYQYPSVKTAHASREAALSGDVETWIDAMVFSISVGALKTGVSYHRWFDSGDLQSTKMLEAIAHVAKKTPHIKHWLPTKEYKFVREYLRRNRKPTNLVIRVSGYMIDGGAPKWALRNRRLTVSTVASGKPASGAFECPSRYQENSCGDCRACWSSRVKHVSYHLH